MKNFASWLLGVFGWRVITPPDNPPKSIICVAPHTSNWDFILGKLYYSAIGRHAGFLMKKDWFFFPLGGIMKSMGGIPVDRSRSGSMVEQLADRIKESSKLSIAITPEGTRSATERWKTGFYRIAYAANIPIQLAVIDYKKRELGIFETFYPTGDEEADIRYIRSRYLSEQARYPKKFIEQ